MKLYLQDQSNSFESYFVLRNNFARSIAAMSISHWIFGIGDRHPENLLLSKTSGKIVGIDFGYAFGYGTRDLPVPELVPFRLTPHILNVFQPFADKGLLFRCMYHALQCYRREKDTILSTMAVFVNEPSINWLEEDSETNDMNESVWDPKTRVDTSRRKLSGANSIMITLDELKKNKNRNHQMFANHFVEGYSKLLKSCAGYSEVEDLSVEDQVKILIQQATDPHLLALMYTGWQGWL